jgi:hypothetical protein
MRAMLDRVFNGVLVLGGAALSALLLYWMTVEALGLDYRNVFQGGLVTAGLIGVVYLADLLPQAR